MTVENTNPNDGASAGLIARSDTTSGAVPKGFYEVECYDADGNLKWTERVENLVTDAGEDHYLDVTLSGATQVTTWYIGLTDGTPTTAETDTMASHAGWAEVTDYSEAARQTWTDGGVSGQSVDNSGSPASFSINASATVGGAFMVSDNTKGGTTGTLLSVAAFSGGDRSLQNGDTLNVTVTQTMGGS